MRSDLGVVPGESKGNSIMFDGPTIVATNQVVAKRLTRLELLHALIGHFERLGERPVRLMSQIERHRRLADLRAVQVERSNVLGIVMEKLTELGVSIGDTIGDIMDTMGVASWQVHYLACDCHEVCSTVPAIAIANRLRRIDDPSATGRMTAMG